MTQTTNRFFDELGKLMTDAAGAAQGAQREMESFMRAQAEKMLAGMDLVKRDEFEAAKAMAAKAREDSESLAERLAALEDEVRRLKGSV
jgi:BMFP domain-containing protein YqiC